MKKADRQSPTGQVVAWLHIHFHEKPVYCVVRPPYKGLEDVSIEFDVDGQVHLVDSMEDARIYVADQTGKTPGYLRKVPRMIDEKLRELMEEEEQKAAQEQNNGHDEAEQALSSIEVIPDRPSGDGRFLDRPTTIIRDEAKLDMTNMAFRPTAQELPRRSFIPKGMLMPLAVQKTISRAMEVDDLAAEFIDNVLELTHSVDGNWAELAKDLNEHKFKQDQIEQLRRWE